LKVLIVDDNPINLKFMYYSLRGDYDIEMAENGYDALKMTEANKYDMIILDLWMPDIDGAELVRQIRSLKSNVNNQTPVMFCTTSSADQDKDRCYSFGADEYLIKPIEVKLLKEKMEQYLG